MNEDKLIKLYKRIEKAKSLPPAELRKYMEALAGIYADIAQENNNLELEKTTLCCFINAGICSCYGECSNEVSDYVYSAVQSVNEDALHKLSGMIDALQMLSEEGEK